MLPNEHPDSGHKVILSSTTYSRTFLSVLQAMQTQEKQDRRRKETHGTQTLLFRCCSNNCARAPTRLFSEHSPERNEPPGLRRGRKRERNILLPRSMHVHAENQNIPSPDRAVKWGRQGRYAAKRQSYNYVPRRKSQFKNKRKIWLTTSYA